MKKSIKDINVKDLLLIQNDATDYYKQFPSGSKLDGMTRVLSNGESITLSYLHSIIQYLKRKDILDKDVDGVIVLSESDSRTGG